MSTPTLICPKCDNHQMDGTFCRKCGADLFPPPAAKSQTLFNLARIGLIAIVIGGVYLYHRMHVVPPPVVEPAPTIIYPSQAGVLNKAMSMAAADANGATSGEEIFMHASPFVVAIYQNDASGKPGKLLGAGFLLNDTTVATNLHVVDGAPSLSARFSDGSSRPVRQVLHASKEHDVALLSVPAPPPPATEVAIKSLDTAARQISNAADSTTHTGTHSASLHIGTAASMHVGDAIVAIGSPDGLSGSVSQGIVTAVNGSLLQTNIPVPSIYSGGPLLNMHGEVVGMLTSQPYAGASGDIALPVEWVSALLTGSGDPSTGTSSATSSATPMPAANDLGPLSFKLAAHDKRAVPFTAPASSSTVQMSITLGPTADTANHLRVTILRGHDTVYTSGDAADTRFAVKLKPGSYTLVLEDTDAADQRDVTVHGTFAAVP